MNLSEMIASGMDFSPKDVQAECETHGLTDHWQVASMNPVCRQCEAVEKEKAAKENADEIYRKYKSVMKSNGVNPEGKKFNEWTFDQTQIDRQQKIIDTLKNIAEKIKIVGVEGRNAKIPNIMLVGGTGSGKTMLANALAKSVYRRSAALDVEHKKDAYQCGRSCAQLITSRDITEQAKATWGTYGDSEHQLIDRLSNMELLIIDDLGDNDTATNEAMAATDRGRVGQIIGKRYQKRPTVITTNLTPDQVVDHLGDRAWDRLQENLIIIQCDWPSYRQSVAKVAYL